MRGYIGLTTTEWIEFIQRNTSCDKAVFWCKKKSFRALNMGEPFYFLRRGKFSSNADRYILGYASFLRFEKMSVIDAWERYKTALGFEDNSSYLDSIKNIYGNCDFELGCIVLNKPVFFMSGVSLAACNIDFSPCIVSGKTITDEECSQIISISRRQ